MTFRWDPSGSARLAFFEEKKTAASVNQESIPDNLNANLFLIQQWAINEDLGSGLLWIMVKKNLIELEQEQDQYSVIK